MLRPLLVVVLGLALPLSGCLGGADAPEPDEQAETPVPREPVLPGNLSAEERVVGATPLSGLLASGSCARVSSATCYRYEIQLADPARVTAFLAWDVEVNDFDLLLLQGDKTIAESRGLPPGTAESLTANLDPGSYDLLVMAYLVTADTFRLDAVFTSR